MKTVHSCVGGLRQHRAVLIHGTERAVALFDEFVVDGRGYRVSAARLQVRQAFPRRTSETTRRGRISPRI
jgi:hypothetical protein